MILYLIIAFFRPSLPLHDVQAVPGTERVLHQRVPQRPRSVEIPLISEKPPKAVEKPKVQVGPSDQWNGWNASQLQWAQLLAGSSGVPFLEQTPVEEGPKGQASAEQRAEEERKRNRAEILKAGERSLLINLMNSPMKETATTEQVKRQKSEIICDLLLGSLMPKSAVEGVSSPPTVSSIAEKASDIQSETKEK